MSAIQSPFFNINYGWAFGEDGWNSGMDTNLQVLSFLDAGSVNDIVASLPLSPVNGYSCILTTDNLFYVRIQGAWLFVAPSSGMEVTEITTSKKFSFNGSTWNEIPTTTSLSSRVGNVESDFADLADSSDPLKGSSLVGHDGRTVRLALQDGALTEYDFSTIQAAITGVGQLDRPLTFGGRTVVAPSVPTNTYGVRFRDGKLLVPSSISGFNTQYNTYADNINGLMVGRENLNVFWKACTAGTLGNIYIYGDSTVENSVAYPLKSADLFQRALYAAGVNGVTTVNRGVSGTSWSDLNTGSDLSATTKLIVIKYGINDAVKTNALQTFAADARSKLTAIRANANGGVTNLSILLMGPNSTFRPSQGQDAKWYESLRNIYTQLCKEFNCAYFDTYAYLQDTKKAPGVWLDNISGSGEGLHPDQVAVYWIWYEGIKTFVLGDGQWNIQKSNQFWNLSNNTRVATFARTPDAYDYGLLVEVANTANGFPFNGILTTFKHADGITSQRLCSQDVVPRTAERRGGGTTWTQFSGIPTAITPLNSWANKGGGYASAGYQIGSDGFVDLFGVLAGGAASSTAFQLPTNARPVNAHEFRLASTGTATLFADGNFIVTGATTTLLSLDGIRFRALAAF